MVVKVIVKWVIILSGCDGSWVRHGLHFLNVVTATTFLNIVTVTVFLLCFMATVPTFVQYCDGGYFFNMVTVTTFSIW